MLRSQSKSAARSSITLSLPAAVSLCKSTVFKVFLIIYTLSRAHSTRKLGLLRPGLLGRRRGSCWLEPLIHYDAWVRTEAATNRYRGAHPLAGEAEAYSHQRAGIGLHAYTWTTAALAAL
jgi:hypothetical protein